MPRPQGLTYDELLRSYARFTAAQANEAVRRNGSCAPASPTPVIASGLREALSPSPVIVSGRSRAAACTSAMTGEAPQRDLPRIRRRLYDGAYRMGAELRRAFRVIYPAHHGRAPAGDIAAIMIKLADSNLGSVSARGLEKRLTAKDKARLQEAVKLSTEVLVRYGADAKEVFLGTLNAGHPGGMLPLTAAELEMLHPTRLPANLYVADATLIPKSLGNPPILTIIALAKRVSKVVQ
jgi:hypothetical protein